MLWSIHLLKEGKTQRVVIIFLKIHRTERDTARC